MPLRLGGHIDISIPGTDVPDRLQTAHILRAARQFYASGGHFMHRTPSCCKEISFRETFTVTLELDGEGFTLIEKTFDVKSVCHYCSVVD
jgi:hypothetical protein